MQLLEHITALQLRTELQDRVRRDLLRSADVPEEILAERNVRGWDIVVPARLGHWEGKIKQGFPTAWYH